MPSHQCFHCKDSLTFIEQSRSHYCEKPPCQRAKMQHYLVEKKKRLTALVAAEIAEYEQNPITQKLPVKLNKELEKTSITVALLPANTNQLIDLGQERKQEFLNHASMIYDDVKRNKPTNNKIYSESLDPPLPQKEAELVGNACATCMGACCNLGKTHAFVDYPSLKHLLASRQPEFSEQQLRELYSDYFPEQSYQYSCVFLGISGCSLPRELRSFNCNNFLCGGAINYHRKVLKADSTDTFAVAVHNDKIMYTSVFSNEDFIRITEK